MNKAMTNIANAVAARREFRDALYMVSVSPATASYPATIKVLYHQTVVAVIVPSENKVTLDNGGYYTVTTKKVINAVLSGLRLPYVLFQEKHSWYLECTLSDFADERKDSRESFKRHHVLALNETLAPALAGVGSGLAPTLGV